MALFVHGEEVDIERTDMWQCLPKVVGKMSVVAPDY
jgi:hypothetical protein